MPANMNNPVLRQLQALRSQVGNQQQMNQRLRQAVEQQEISRRQGLVDVNGPQDVFTNLKRALPDYLMPGNLGDVNKVCWPFWFTNQTPILPKASGGTQTQAKASVTITQEAAFIVTAIMKSVFIYDSNAGTYTYVDAGQVGATPLTPGLSMNVIDAQSSRNFMSSPLQLDNIGYAAFPTELPTPLMFLPNSIIETQLFNSNASNNYVPWITFLGVRCRIEDAQQILSLVTG